VVQNITRDVNIALINEISEAALAMDIDVSELSELVNTHPRVKLLKPGPGVGGYCLPNALSYLREALKDKNCELTLMSTARNCNNQRPYKVIGYIKKALGDVGKKIYGSTIGLIGLAMKDNCADCRFSPALTIAAELLKSGARLRAYDPVVSDTYDFKVDSLDECVKEADCLVITAKQQGVVFDMKRIGPLMAEPFAIVDTRGVLPKVPGVVLYHV
jgi:UDP-N-acetyl-D-mannosaminuronic acid dehydrogenase